VNKQLKILFFASSFQTGLTCLLTEHLCALVKIQDVSLHAVFGEGEQQPGLIERLDVQKINYSIIRRLDEHREFGQLKKELVELMAYVTPDYIMVQTNWQLALVFFAKRSLQKCPQVIYWVHGYRNNHRLKSFIARIIIGSALRIMADHVIVSSRSVANCFRSFLSQNVLHQYYLGVDQLFFDSYKNSTTRYSNKTIIFPGQFREGKNQEWLIRAVAFYIQETNDNSIKLLLPGDGPKKELCQKIAIDLNIPNNVVFPGYICREALIKLYNDSAIAVIPSNNETFGSCIAEPFVLGSVVVSRPVGCAVDVIHDGENGFLFRSECELKKLLLVLLNDPGKLATVAEKSKETRDQFSWENICQKYVREIIN
jgi:glycosyltransferase involved in cell wall biosynthesis